MNPWIILATCGPAAVVSALMLAAICRAASQPPPYVSRPRPTQAAWDADYWIIVRRLATTTASEPRRYPRTDA